ncbi:MAG: hypothetical protein ACI9KE_000715 [Polyangiales bacterium]|jgi:hypothetical protein
MWSRVSGLVVALMGCSLVNAPSGFQDGDAGSAADSEPARDGSDGSDVPDGAADAEVQDGGPTDAAGDVAVDAGRADAGPEGWRILQIEAGRAHACVRLEGGRVVCWGSNDQGQLGHATDGPDFVDTALRFGSIAVEENVTCGVTFTLEAYCWGQVDSNPPPLAGLFFRVGEAVQSVSIGNLRDTTLTVICTENQGAVDCYVSTALQAPGGLNGLFGDSWAPPGMDIVKLSVGRDHFVFETGGVVRSFGNDVFGQQGDASRGTGVVLIPEGAEGRIVEELAADSNRSCASTGTSVWCWGQAGFPNADGSDAIRSSPVDLLIAGPILDLDLAPSFGCAAAGDGVQCWGLNPDTTDGIPPSSPVPPIDAGGPGTRLVATGSGFACNVSGRIATRCWGANDSGQLGGAPGPSGAASNILSLLLGTAS